MSDTRNLDGFAQQSCAKGGFTPGPWAFDGPPNSRIVWAGIEHRVCFLTSDGPNLANARLIAAAPELLEALECVESEMELDGQLQEIVANAIAKARGQA